MADSSLVRGVVAATVVLKDGRAYKETVEHPTGSPDRPMTDVQLESKFRALAAEALPLARSERLLKACWELEKIANLGDFASLIRSGDKGERIAEIA